MILFGDLPSRDGVVWMKRLLRRGNRRKVAEEYEFWEEGKNVEG